VAGWLSPDPQALPGAALAWTGALDDQQRAVVYSMQWNNPRPDVPIDNIDIVASPDDTDWGVPAVFAITTATAQQ
jgi:hypothetical protein